jgi:hypothetical protein
MAKPNASVQAERPKRLSRNKRKKLIKYQRFNQEEKALLKDFLEEEWIPLMIEAVEEGLTLKTFLSQEESRRERIGKQLSSHDPKTPIEKKKNMTSNRIERIFQDGLDLHVFHRCKPMNNH